MRARSWKVLVAASLLWVAIACLDITPPIPGISAITPVLLPTPSIVINDTMRDTAGNVTPLHVVAFSLSGKPFTDVTVSWLAIDSTKNLSVNDTGLATAAGTFNPFGKIVATVVQKGGTTASLQTPQVTVPVVPKPIVARKDTNFKFTPTLPATPTDTLSSQLLSPGLAVTVKANQDSAVPSYPVIYKIVRRPPPNDTVPGPTVVATNSTGRDSTVGITNSSGVAQIYLRLRPSAIQGKLLVIPDTVVVKYWVLFRKDTVPAAPTDSFVIQVQAKTNP